MSRPGFPISNSQNVTVTNHYHDADNNITYDGTDQCFIRSVFEDKVGNNTVGWPSNIQTNSYLRSKFLWSQNHLTVDGHVPSTGDSFYGDWGNTFGLGYDPWTDTYWSTSAVADDVRNKLISKLISKVQAHRVDFGEILATRKQCADMVAKTLNRLASAVGAARKGNFSGATRQLLGASGHKTPVRRNFGGVPEWWLAHKYGWQPLLGDVYNSCETVRKAWNDDGDLFTASAKVTMPVPKKTRVFRHPINTHGPEITHQTTTNRVAGQAAIVYGVSSNIEHSLSQLGITNPYATAWNLLPYSFVVDWFFPIGNFLESLDYSRGLYFKYGWLSMKRETGLRMWLSDRNSANPVYPASWTGGEGNGSAMVFTREALGSFPTLPLPQFKDPLSLTHVANGLSLLSQAFGR